MDSYRPRQISQSDCEISSNCGKIHVWKGSEQYPFLFIFQFYLDRELHKNQLRLMKKYCKFCITWLGLQYPSKVTILSRFTSAMVTS